MVTDKQGNVVTGLKKDDFEIIESGQKQVLSFFSAESLKPKRRNAEATGNAPSSNRRLTTAAPPRRTIVFLVDTVHMQDPANVLRVEGQLRKFIDDVLGDEDLAAVVATSAGLGVFSQFTQDKWVLQMAVDRLHTAYLSLRSGTDSLVVAGALRAEEESEMTRATLLTVKAVATRLAEMPGQRLILMISDGLPLMDRTGVLDTDDLHAAISRASRSGVVIYTMLAKGLTGPSLYSAARRSLPDNPGAALFGERLSEYGLERLAKATGGEAFLTTNDLAGAMEKAVGTNNYYYALGYYPLKLDSTNGFHSIEVRIKRHPDFMVRTQSGYLATELGKKDPPAPADPEKDLFNALSSPLDLAGINVGASAKFLTLPVDDAQVSLEVLIDNTRLGYTQQGDSMLTRPILMIGVLDKDSQTVSVLRDSIEIRVSRPQLERARGAVYRYTRRLALKPGLYQIRVGVRDEQTGQIGTAAAWVEVPDEKLK